MSDVEKELYSLTKSMEATSDASGNLMASMKAIKESHLLTVISRMASGVLPTFWSIQNKFRAIADAFVGYDKLSNKLNETTLKQIKSFSELSSIYEKFPEELLKKVNEVGEAIVDVPAFDPFNTAEFDDLDNWIATAKEKFKEFDMFETMTEGYGPEVLKEEIEQALQTEKDRLDKKKAVLQKEFKGKRDFQDQMKKYNIGEKDKLKQFLLKKKMALGKLISGAGPFFKKAIVVLAKAMYGFIWIALIATGIAFLVKQAWPVLVAVWSAVLDGLKMAWHFFKVSLEGLSEILTGIWTGDFVMVLMGIMKFVGGMIATMFFLGVSILWAAIGTVAALLGGPIWLTLKDLLAGEISNTRAFGQLIGHLLMVGGMVAAAYAWFTSGAWLGSILVALFGWFISAVSKHAGGGTVHTPFQIVGEKGPELVSLPKGSRVHTNANSNAMLGGSNTINVHVNGRVGASDAEIRDIADKVGRAINIRMNRTANTQTRF